MKKKILAIIFLIIIGVSPIMASVDFATYGLTYKNKEIENDVTVMYFLDKDARRISVSSNQSLDAQDFEKISSINKTFSSWKYLEYTSLSFFIDGERIQILLKPDSFVYESINLVPYAPAGFFFTQTPSGLAYNFRLTSGASFPKLKGIVNDEESFCKEVLAVLGFSQVPKVPSEANSFTAAQESPSASDTTMSDFEGNNVQIMELIKKLQEEGSQNNDAFELFKDKVSDRIGSIEENVPTRQEIVDLENKNAKLAGELEDSLIQQKDLIKEVLELQQSLKSLSEEVETLRKAMITLHDKGLFGSVNIVDSETISRILKMKDKDPKLTIEEAYSTLAKEKYSVTEYEVMLIFSVYFNEFK
ncbi:hypothetical protein [uncultured Sphaerochaeta sp.]|uniref:hypothetical protein n=1 Tax=uncultured Sphaerochaeta sp. TaxID=886478 RepID=UPI002A0A8F3C|nr:hypothetical protein [uncultured Sphaerochaeta sp.]